MNGVNESEGIEKLEDSKAFTDFIESLKSKSTKTMYRKGIQVFCAWYSKSIDGVLAERKDDVTPRPNESMVDSKQRSKKFENLLEKYHNWLTSEQADRKAYLPSTATSMCKGLMQIFRYYDMPIALRSGSPISEGREYSEANRYPLTPEDVRKMFWKSVDLRTKLWITMANDVPIRIGDFAKLLVKHLPNLNEQPPILYRVRTEKEKTIAISCLSADTVKLLKEFIGVFKPEKYLWETKINGELHHVSEDTLNRTMQWLARECQIELGPYTISWHCWRDFAISVAQNLNIDPNVYHLITGKKVRADIAAYMSGVKIKPAFELMHQTMRINGELLVAKEVDLLTQLGQQVQGLQTRIEYLENIFKAVFGAEHTTETLAKIDEALKKLKGETQ